MQQKNSKILSVCITHEATQKALAPTDSVAGRELSEFSANLLDGEWATEPVWMRKLEIHTCMPAENVTFLVQHIIQFFPK